MSVRPVGKRKRKGRKTKHLEKYTLRIPANRSAAAYADAQDVSEIVYTQVRVLERTERPRENLGFTVSKLATIIFNRKKSRYFAKFFPSVSASKITRIIPRVEIA